MKGVAPIDHVTPSAFMRSMAALASNFSCSTALPPKSNGEMRPWLKPVAWLSGAGMNMTSSAVSSSSPVNARSE